MSNTDTTATLTPFQHVLAKMAEAGHPVNPRTHMATCPAHDDPNASLSIIEGDDGRVLLKCFAGCPFEAIIARIGVEAQECFPSAVTAETPMPADDRTVRMLANHLEPAAVSRAAARNMLAAANTPNERGAVPSAKSLMFASHELAAQEAAFQLLQTAHDIANSPNRKNLMGWLLEQALTKPDDRWSGYGNDLQRAIYERQMDTLRIIRNAVAHGGNPTAYGLYPDDNT